MLYEAFIIEWRQRDESTASTSKVNQGWAMRPSVTITIYQDVA